MIKAKILSIKSCEGVSYYEFEVYENRPQNFDEKTKLSMLALSPYEGASVGDMVWLNFKSSDLFLSRSPLKECSVQNELNCEILKLSMGEILSLAHLKFKEYEFESIISTSSCSRLNLKEGEKIFAYIKATSIYIGSTERE